MIAPREMRFAEDGAFARAVEHAATDRHPVDDIEPVADQGLELREARSRFVYILHSALGWILTAKNPRLGAAQCAFALGATALFDGASMEDVAGRFSATRAALSKGARNFCKSAGIAPTGSLKKDTEVYRQARIASVKKRRMN